MKNLKTFALAGTVALASTAAFTASAADRSDLHGGDYKWMQANLMYSVGEKPENKSGGDQHDYLEMEFGGRSGIFDLYGYVDVFNLSNRTDKASYDKDPSKAKIFIKFNPRISLDAVTGKDLSFGPVKEVYFSTLFNWSGDSQVNNSFWGVGADVEVPWLGKVGMNLYTQYELNKKKWDGYQFSMNWFKPFYFLDNGSFIAYQGYIDYQWGVDKTDVILPTGVNLGQLNSTSGGAMFHGIYWHSDRFALGYGLKGYNEVYALKDGGVAGETTGWSHYFAATYKF